MHIEKTRTYVGVFAALMVLTAITVWVAYFDFKAFNDVVAMSIALVKATLVVMIFMHVRHSSRLTKMMVVAALFWLVLLFAFPVADELTRGYFDVPGK